MVELYIYSSTVSLTIFTLIYIDRLECLDALAATLKF